MRIATLESVHIPGASQGPTLMEALEANGVVSAVPAGKIFGGLFDPLPTKVDQNGKLIRREATIAEEIVGGLLFGALVAEGAAAYLGTSIFGAAAAPTAVATVGRTPFAGFQEWGRPIWSVTVGGRSVSGVSGARAAIANLTAAVASTIDPGKAKLAMDFYQRAADAGRGGDTAPVRAELFRRILELQGKR